MSKVLIRHEMSEANNRENVGTLLFGHPAAPLMPESWERAAETGLRLAKEFGIMLVNTRVATSTFRRSRESAMGAGFGTRTAYACLDEVEHGLPLEVLKAMLEQRELPEKAREKARFIVKNPPPERFYETHGLTYLGLLDYYGIERPSDGRFVPEYGEFTEIPLGD